MNTVLNVIIFTKYGYDSRAAHYILNDLGGFALNRDSFLVASEKQPDEIREDFKAFPFIYDCIFIIKAEHMSLPIDDRHLQFLHKHFPDQI